MPKAGGTILVVDDEESMLLAVEAILLRGGYPLITARNAREALQKSRDFKGDIHLLLTDVMMPEVGGLTLAHQLVEERPNLRVLLMSGYTSTPSRLPLLRKPFRLTQLLEQVSSVIAGPPPDPADVLTPSVTANHGLRAALTY